MANVFPGLAGSAIGVASKTPSSQQQTMLLEQIKTLAESAVQMLYNVQEAGGNPKVNIMTLLELLIVLLLGNGCSC